VSQNFCGKNLRGYSFVNQNLIDADFSNTDIRGANFSGAILKGANFSNAKAGLRFWQKAILMLSASISLITLGFASLTIVLIIHLFFPYSLGTGQDPIVQESAVIIAGLFMLFFTIVFFFGKDLVTASTATIVAGIVFGFLIGTLSGTTAGLVTGLISTNLSVLYTLLLLWLMPICLSIMGALGGLRAIFLGMSLAFLAGIAGIPITLIAIAELFTVIAGTGESPQRIPLIIDDIQQVGTTISIALALISGYVAKRICFGDERFASIAKVVLNFSCWGGTNFHFADLTDANFTRAIVQQTNFANAILTRTNFYQVKQLKQAQLGDTILSNSQVRKLLISRQGAGLSLVGSNLKGANLTNADLSSANLERADLEAAKLTGAILEKANLSKTRALAADFTGARLSGACLENWQIDLETKLERVHCHHIYLKSGERERRPLIGNFKSGQLTKFYNNSLNYIFAQDLDSKQVLALIKIDRGNFRDGFSVTLQIGKEGETYSQQFSGQLSSAPEIPQYYQQWQSIYNEGLKDIFRYLKTKYRKIEVNNIEATNFTIEDFLRECSQSAEKFQESLNLWLNNEVFRPVKEELLQYLNPDISIRTVLQIEKEAEVLRRLPWHLWNFFERYPQAEIALSSQIYQKPNLIDSLRTRSKNKVKILAIVGDSTGINVEHDKDFLQQIPDAEVVFKCEPNRRELHDGLWTQHWDILFFAGHSSSSLDGATGQIQINNKDSLKIADLKHALRKAVKQGLQLAIFNSCDGLGLATDLADLHIPQAIVMREPVPDVVAQEFLKNFLAGFSQGNSLYNSVRQAREKLEGLEDEFPCATWLPVIYQNPAVIPPIWQDLRDN